MKLTCIFVCGSDQTYALMKSNVISSLYSLNDSANLCYQTHFIKCQVSRRKTRTDFLSNTSTFPFSPCALIFKIYPLVFHSLTILPISPQDTDTDTHASNIPREIASGVVSVSVTPKALPLTDTRILKFTSRSCERPRHIHK